MAKKRVLFVSHDASRTGAPILLLNLAKALKDIYDVHFLLKHGGALTAEFVKAGKTVLLEKNTPYLQRTRIFKKLIRKSATNRFDFSKVSWKDYDLILSNTITNGDILPEIKRLFKGDIISYIHELEMATRFFTSPANLQQLIAGSTAFFAPSIAVKTYLIDNLRIDERKIALLPYYIPPAANNRPIRNKPHEGIFTIGGIGTSDWRKSPDLFIIVAKLLFSSRANANIKFVWKGAEAKGVAIDRLHYDIKKAGLDGKVFLSASSADVTTFYQAIDLLLLVSREDPYPLVVLEAADYHCPTICFSGAGGAQEFIEDANAGYASPFLDLNSIVNKILFYYDHPHELHQEGRRAKNKLNESHHNIDYIKAQFNSAVKQVLPK